MDGCSLGDWYTEELRLSVFLIDAIEPAGAHFWEPLLGNAPEEVYNRPREPRVREEGPFLNGRLRVEVSVNRVDWTLLPAPGIDHHRGLPPVVGSYEALEKDFRVLMLKWLADCPSLHRLGYGSELLLPAGSLPDAYGKLNGLLRGVDVEPENTQDFLYRINRRRTSSCGVEGLEINRISTWSAVQIIETFVDVSGAGERPPKVTRRPDPEGICRLEFDINTIPEFDRALDKDVVPKIFDELVDAGNEIAAKGDVS